MKTYLTLYYNCLNKKKILDFRLALFEKNNNNQAVEKNIFLRVAFYLLKSDKR